MKQGKDRFKPLGKEVEDLIVMYRKEHKLSYRAIEKKMEVSRETARLVCLKRIPEEEEKSRANKKRLAKKKVIVRSITKKPKPRPQHNSVRDYDFLQYIRIVYKWALQHHPDLNRGNLEMLLYLYPKGAFTYSQFHKYYKTIGLYQRKMLKRFMDDGYIKVWRVPKRGESKLYSLTDKSKKLCDMMHKYCTGDEKLPMDERNNLVTDKSKRINNYYVDMIKDMNKRKKATD